MVTCFPVSGRKYRHFGGVHAGDPPFLFPPWERIFLAETLSDTEEQGVIFRAVEVGGDELGGITPASCAPDGKNASFEYLALGNQDTFVSIAIDGINDQIERSLKDLLCVVLCEKGHLVVHRALRMDLMNPLCHDPGFRHAHSGVQRMDLAVYVGDTNFIHIHQSDLSNPAAREGFHNPRADTTYPHHTDMCGAQSL